MLWLPASSKKKGWLPLIYIHVFFLHNNLHSTTNKTCFFVCPSRSHIIISKTRDQMWSSLKLFNGHVRMASDISSDKHILLWHQIAPELYCAVWCIDLYTKAQKVHGRAGSSESLKIWRGNIFSSERTSFAESVRGWRTSPLVMPPFPTSLAWQGGGGFHQSLLDPMANMQQQGT